MQRSGKVRAVYLPTNEMFENAKVVTPNEEGALEPVEDFQGSYVPEGFELIRPEKYKGKIDIDIKQEDLDEFVQSIALQSKDGLVFTKITKNVDNETKDFWSHEELSIEVPTKGKVFDLSDPIDYFWYEVMSSYNACWDQTAHERPENLVGIRWTIVKEGDRSQDKEVKTEISFLRLIDRSTAPRIKLIMDQMSIGFDPGTKKDDLVVALLDDYAIDNTRRSSLGDSYRDCIIRITEGNDMQVEISGLVEESKHIGILKKQNKQILFKGRFLGDTFMDVVAYLNTEEGEEDLEKIKEAVAEYKNKED